MTLGTLADFEVETLTTLTAVGTTTAIESSGVNVCFQVTVSSISTNVVIRFEASLDNTNFFNLDQSGADTTITANGTYGFALNGCPVKYLRLRLVSISGGTPSVASKVGAI